MKITIESTDRIIAVTGNGTMVREWKGVTKGGVPCTVFVQMIRVDRLQDNTQDPDGTTTISCSRRSQPRRNFYCVTCLKEPNVRAGVFLCDFPIGDGKTCSAAICVEHSHHVTENQDLCPDHYKTWLDLGQPPIKEIWCSTS